MDAITTHAGAMLNYATPINIAVLMMLFTLLMMLMSGTPKTRLPNVDPSPLMTPAERNVIGHIEAALPTARIHAQVSMGAFLKPRRGLDRSQAQTVRNRFSSKRVDFIAEDRNTGNIIAIIELDDRSHRPEADRDRDRMTRSAGYRTIRLPAGKQHTRQSVFMAIHQPQTSKQ